MALIAAGRNADLVAVGAPAGDAIAAVRVKALHQPALNPILFPSVVTGHNTSLR